MLSVVNIFFFDIVNIINDVKNKRGYLANIRRYYYVYLRAGHNAGEEVCATCRRC